EGATLGALWLCSECCRYSVLSLKPPKLDPHPEGRHVAAAVWLNIHPTLCDNAVPLFEWLRLPGRGKLPMTFVRGDNDPAAVDITKPFLINIPGAAFSETIVPDSKASGHALLKQNLGTEALILAYCDQVLKDRPATPWAPRDVERKVYCWTIP